MTIRRCNIALAILLVSTAAFADWQNVAPGVDYQEFRDGNQDIHVTRIDLTNDSIRVIVSRESEKGMKVSDFARKVHAVAAINGDYYDQEFNPIGLTVGPCGEWVSAKKTKREGYVAIGEGQARIARQTEVDPAATAEEWMKATVSGWPALVVHCDPLSSSNLPGSDAFTRAPHPRTAVGLTDDRETLFLVVADGRRTGVPGLTLSQLGRFMADRLKACSAINFDGGGSAAMWVSDRIVNRPADGVERHVADHLAVVLESDYVECDLNDEAEKIAAMKTRVAKQASTTTTTTITTTTVTTTTTTPRPMNSASPSPPRQHR